MTLDQVVLILLAAYALFLFLVARRASRSVESLRDFFSFKPKHGLTSVIRTFEASNASFMTAFLALFLYTFALGLATLWIPVGFCLGILFYAFFFLPRQADHLRAGHRFPYLLERLTGSRHVRPFAAIFIVLSFWLFFFAEMQGALRFLRELLLQHPAMTWFLPLLLVAGMVAYTYAAGFQAVVLTDRVQLWLIRLGTYALILLVLRHFMAPDTDFSATVRSAAGFLDFKAFIVQTLIGFAFSQLLYYDNWLRLSLFFGDSRRKLSDEEFHGAVAKLKRLYAFSALSLLVIYSAPVLVALQEMSHEGTTAAAAALAGFFVEAYQGSLLGSLLVVLALLHLFSALVSTADTYVISATASITEDLFRQDLHDTENPKALDGSRFIAAVFAASVLPMAFTDLDFSTLFIYLFYSANGFVGPLCAIITQRRISGLNAITSIALGFLIPLAFLLVTELKFLFDWSGAIVVAVSLGLFFFGPKRLDSLPGDGNT